MLKLSFALRLGIESSFKLKYVNHNFLKLYHNNSHENSNFKLIIYPKLVKMNTLLEDLKSNN